MCGDFESTSVPGARETLLAALEAEQGSAYVLRSDLSLEYVNEAWHRFARENTGFGSECRWDFREPITAYFCPPLRELFTAKLKWAIERNQGFCHSYECSSSELYRKFNMRVQPTVEWGGLIVVHSLVVETLLMNDRVELEALAAHYTDARGLIVQCSSCGRVREPANSSWHWAPGLVSVERENVSHGICPTCNFQYYG